MSWQDKIMNKTTLFSHCITINTFEYRFTLILANDVYRIVSSFFFIKFFSSFVIQCCFIILNSVRIGFFFLLIFNLKIFKNWHFNLDKYFHQISMDRNYNLVFKWNQLTEIVQQHQQICHEYRKKIAKFNLNWQFTLKWTWVGFEYSSFDAQFSFNMFKFMGLSTIFSVYTRCSLLATMYIVVIIHEYAILVGLMCLRT